MPPARAAKALRPIDWLGGSEEDGGFAEARRQLMALCGYWVDQKGSAYHLLPGSAHSLHVYTARPSGRHRYTAHLVRLALHGGTTQVVWGANRYSLAGRGQGLDAITWQGRSEKDHFDWVRVA